MNARPIVALAAVLALAGCQDNNASIEIFGICAPPDDAVKCSGTAVCSLYFAGDRPWVYTSVGGAANVNRLVHFVQINNQLPNNADPGTGRVNTNDFIAEEYLYDFQGVPGLTEWRRRANFTIIAEGSFSPVIPIIPEEAMAVIQAAFAANSTTLVVVGMRVRGHLNGGAVVETGTYEIAVDVINSDFPGYAACTNATDILFVCPNQGQQATVGCAAAP